MAASPARAANPWPAPGCTVYQTDASGHYTPDKPMDEPHARLAGWLQTGKDGRLSSTRSGLAAIRRRCGWAIGTGRSRLTFISTSPLTATRHARSRPSSRTIRSSPTRIGKTGCGRKDIQWSRSANPQRDRWPISCWPFGGLRRTEKVSLKRYRALLGLGWMWGLRSWNPARWAGLREREPSARMRWLSPGEAVLGLEAQRAALPQPRASPWDRDRDRPPFNAA